MVKSKFNEFNQGEYFIEVPERFPVIIKDFMGAWIPGSSLKSRPVPLTCTFVCQLNPSL